MKTRHTKIAIALALLAVAAATLAVATRGAREDKRPRKTELQQALDEIVAAGAPGALVLVRDGDRTVRLASGFGNLKPKTPMHASDRFRIGSVTKTYVATVVLQLVGEGKLSLDDTVEQRLPGVVPNGTAITVRQLLNMTSGLFDYLMDGDHTVVKPYLAGNVAYAWKPRQLVEVAVSHEPEFAPGTGWSYCNTCYVVLGLIVERTTGRPIVAELQRRIFDPLHLDDTTFETGPQIAGPHAHGYELEGSQLVDVSVLSPSFGWAAGAIVSTADDVAAFYRALLGGRLLGPDLMRAMQTTVAAVELGAGYRYGLGLARVPPPCGGAWGHGGGTPGYSTRALNSRDGKRQVVLVATSDESLSPRAGQAIERLLATAYCGRAHATAATAPASGVTLKGALDQLVAAGVPGAVVLVRKNDRTVRLASGYGALKQKTKMRTADRFRVGKVTKAFVATVVLQLVAEGKLSLDDTVERRLPGVVPNGERITVRRLLNHTSGLFDYGGDEKFLAAAFRDPMKDWTPREIVAIATAHKPNFAPGAGWSYANTNYYVLGLIVEAATGRPLARELRERIFTPLGLRATSFDSGPRIAGRHAHGYFLKPLEDVTVGSPSIVWAAGALVSNADDLATFFRALLGGRLVRPDLLRAMETTIAGTPEFSYGLGLEKVRTSCGVAWGHTGGMPGYNTNVLNTKDGRRQVVVLVNASDLLSPGLKNFKSFDLPRRAQPAYERLIETAYCR